MSTAILSTQISIDPFTVDSKMCRLDDSVDQNEPLRDDTTDKSFNVRSSIL